LPLNGEGESVEAGVNVNVKTAADIAAEGAMSDSTSASEVADDPGSVCPSKAPGRLFTARYSPRRFCSRWLNLFRDGIEPPTHGFSVRWPIAESS